MNHYENKIFVVTQRKNADKEKYPAVSDLLKLDVFVQFLSCLNSLMDLFVSSCKAKKLSLKNTLNSKITFMQSLRSLNRIFSDQDLNLKAYIKTFINVLNKLLNRIETYTDDDLVKNISNIKNPYEMYYFALANLEIPIVTKQMYYEFDDLKDALQVLISFLMGEIELLKIQNDLESKK